MRKIGLIVDEAASLSQDLLKKFKIKVFKYAIEVEGKKENLYQLKTPPPTAVKPKEISNAISETLKEFEKAVLITLSSSLSAAFSIALNLVKNFFDPQKILVIDSKNVCAGEGLLALKINELIKEGRSLKEIRKEAEKLISKIKDFYCFGDARFLAKSGRMKPTLAYIIFFLEKIGLRILTGFKEGKLKPVSFQLFSFDKAKAIFLEVKKRASNKKINCAIVHFGNLKDALRLKEMVEKNLSAKVLFLEEGSPVVGTKTGPGSLGLSFYEA